MVWKMELYTNTRSCLCSRALGQPTAKLNAVQPVIFLIPMSSPLFSSEYVIFREENSSFLLIMQFVVE